PHVHAHGDQALDVRHVVGVAAVGDLNARHVHALVLEDLDLARTGPGRGHRVRHDRRPRLHAGARARAVDLLDVLGHAGGVRRALDECGPDGRSLDPTLDVGHEVLGHRVDVAVCEVLGEVVVAVDPGAGNDANTRLLGHVLHEEHVAPAEHRRRVDDRAHATRARRRDRVGGRGELRSGVVAVGPRVRYGLFAYGDV